MPDTKDDDDALRQPRDHWGGLLQNEYGRALGRIEGKLDEQAGKIRELQHESKQSGDERNKALKDIEERVRGNAHKAANDLQNVSLRLEKAQVTIDTTKAMVEQVGVQVSGLDTRVKLMEMPNAARTERRARWRRWWIWLAGVLLFLWGGLGEPIFRALAPMAVQRWFTGNLPHN